MPRSHTLKTLQPWFHDVLAGHKTFELRFNDREFAVGDRLLLQEQSPLTGELTGQELSTTVTYFLGNDTATVFGVQPGFCILGLSKPVSDETERGS